MLLQLLHWSEMAATVVEGFLLIRMLSLRLQRLYTFLTLYWTVSLIFDIASWVLGWETPQTITLSLYSLFLYSALLPLAAWDAFEEMKPVIGRLRLLQGSRMVSGLFATLFMTTVLFAFLSPTDPDKDPGFLGLAPLVWFGSACASILFLWTLRLIMRKQNLPVPANTALWLYLLLILIGCDIVNMIGSLVTISSPVEVQQVPVVILNAVSIVAMLWAMIKMKAVPTETSPEPQKASL